ncbi:toll/interleukin-1 receptor domain-containing protein [Bradyrhizobium sp.]|jgi:hypothetical protein|uniref:toll/interleukin-1 receptor domain-containing protein n=1 Tax=Bradyrhizobium sp. TaxID=376 RepID=UPI003C1A7E69
MGVPHIFLSYAAEDASWKRNFAFKEWFGDLLGPVEFVDYKMGEELPFGPIDEWLSNRVREATVFIAFVSKDYIDKNYPIKEWWAALSETSRQRFIFVPLMLDGSAKSWWRQLKEGGSLRDLGDDYAYSDFTDGNGRPALIVTEIGLAVDAITRRIGELARLIREHIDELTDRSAATAHTDLTSTPAEPKEAPAAEADGQLSAGSCPVIVLGHPSANPSAELTAKTRELASALAANDVPFVQWGDQWRARRCSGPSRTQQPYLFIQPAGPGDAGDLAEERSRLSQWLQRCLRSRSTESALNLLGQQQVLWLPEGLSDETFEKIMKAAPEDTNLVLRSDSPLALANWIRGKRIGNAPQNVPVLTLEEVDVNDAGKLREALHSSFHKIVGELVQPAPELWTFDCDLLVRQIEQMEADHAIVAVHDLNTGVARGQREARNQLEQKLGTISSEVDRAVRAAGRKDLKLFWTALLVQKAEQLPWVKYPAPSQFENWCLLPYTNSPATESGADIVSPKQGPLKIFRTYLRDWVNEINA